MISKEVLIPVQRFFYEKGNKFQLANYCGTGFFNPDIIIVTSSDYAIDIEIKVSRSDFKADFKKETKHWYLKSKKTKQAYFYYAVPFGLIKIEEVPEYAGLIYVRADGKKVEVIKKAPKLHSNKITVEEKLLIANAMSARIIFGQSLMNLKKKERTQ